MPGAWHAAHAAFAVMFLCNASSGRAGVFLAVERKKRKRITARTKAIKPTVFFITKTPYRKTSYSLKSFQDFCQATHIRLRHHHFSASMFTIIIRNLFSVKPSAAIYDGDPWPAHSDFAIIFSEKSDTKPSISKLHIPDRFISQRSGHETL
jgi:hypothetical protein